MLAGDSVEFTIPGEPVAWARARLSGRVHFTPNKQRSHGHVVGTIAALAMRGRPPFIGPVSLEIDCTWLRPKSASKGNPPSWKQSKPDADNVAKQISDAINTIVWRDDAQVVKLSVAKRYADTAQTFVRIAAIA